MYILAEVEDRAPHYIIRVQWILRLAHPPFFPFFFCEYFDDRVFINVLLPYLNNFLE
jgi:hypothetical protein